MTLRSYFVEPPVNIRVLNADGLMGLAWQTYMSTHVARQLGRVSQNSTLTDPPSLTSGQRAKVNIPAPGARAGDFAYAAFDLPNEDVTLTAHVSAADTITVWFQNLGAGTVDLAAGRLYVEWRKR